MKKVLSVICVLITIFMLSGCKKNSEYGVQDECKRAIAILDDYFDFEISKKEARSRFERLDCDAYKKTSKDDVICSTMSLIEVELNSISNNDSDIRTNYNELKNRCK